MAVILIIDDERNIRFLFRQGLEIEHEILEAADSVEALQLVNQHFIDLIICDLALPSKNGIDLIREIRQLGNQAKIIACSAHLARDVHNQAILAGADLFLEKPLSIFFLCESVNNLLKS